MITLNREVSFKRVALAVLLVLFLPIWLAIPVAIWNHVSNLVARFSDRAPEAEYIQTLPDPPLPGDDALETVLKIAGQIDGVITKDLRKRDCFGERPPYHIDSGCTVFLETQAGPLKAFDEWLMGSSPYKLARPAQLGRRSRVLILKATMVGYGPTPIFHPGRDRLVELLAIRSLKMLQIGNTAAARRDLGTIFALGSFFQQIPDLSSQIVGLPMHSKALGLIQRHVGVDQSEGFEALLPDLRPYLEQLRWGLKLDGLSTIDSIPGGHGMRFSDYDDIILGTYSRTRTWQQYLDMIRDLQDYLDAGKLGTSFAVRRHLRCPQEPERVFDVMGWSQWFPNARGRSYVCDMYPGQYARFTAWFGQIIDQVEATRVILAARQFYRKNKRWPTKESDLVPSFLKAWPVSALNGQPIRWQEDMMGVILLDVDGKRACCQLPFVSPPPVSTPKQVAPA